MDGCRKPHGKLVFVGSWPSSDPYGTVVVNGYNAALKIFGYDGTYRAPEQLNFDAVEQARHARFRHRREARRPHRH